MRDVPFFGEPSERLLKVRPLRAASNWDNSFPVMKYDTIVRLKEERVGLHPV